MAAIVELLGTDQLDVKGEPPEEAPAEEGAEPNENEAELAQVQAEQALADKTAVGLFFSSRNEEKDGEKCAAFLQVLVEAYNATLKEKGLEVVFVCADDTQEEFSEAYKDMPWPALPFACRDQQAALIEKYEIQEFPKLVLLDAEGQTLTASGVEKVMEDIEGENFPWAEEQGPPPITESEIMIQMGDCDIEPGIPKEFKGITLNLKRYVEFNLVDSAEKVPGMHYCGMKCKPWCVANKAAIVEEIRKNGIMSDFQPLSKDIDKFEGDTLLLILDAERVYGQKFAMCATEVCYEREWGKIQEKYKGIEDAYYAQFRKPGAVMGEDGVMIEAEEEEEDDMLDVVVRDAPKDCGEWVTETMEATHAEVANFAVQNSRPLMQVMISRSRLQFGKPCKIIDSGELQQHHCRPHKDPNFILQRRELEIGIQAVKEVRTASSQTTWHRPVNKSTQYDPNHFLKDTNNELAEEQVLALSDFLSNVSNMAEEALQTNETVDIFQEEFAHLGDEEVGAIDKTASNMKEFRNFVDVTYTKNKRIEWVEWVPESVDMLACSCCDTQPFSERVDTAGKATVSTILIWYFHEQLNPHVILQSPWDVPMFKFYPSHEHHGWYLVGGLSSGQLIVWKLTDADLGHAVREKGRARAEDEKTSSIPLITHKAISVTDDSHRRPVLGIEWLPPALEIERRGRSASEKNPTDGPVKYMVTIAGDGQVMIWDFLALLEGLNENDFSWRPVHKVQLHRQDTGTEMGCCHILYCHDRMDDKGNKLLTQFYASTEEGELVLADWAARAEEDRKPEVVKKIWDSQKTYRPMLSLERSPFFPDVLLGVTDWAFYLWKDGLKPHLFQSSYTSNYFTRGVWSPTRPSVIFLGNVLGEIDIWDFSDQSHKASLTDKGGQGVISSMKFLMQGDIKSDQKLAVGDAHGHLHVHNIPKSLVRELPKELQTMGEFLEREEQRVASFEARTRELVALKDELEKEAQMAADRGEEDEDKKGKDMDKQDQQDQIDEAKYKQLELACNEELKGGGGI